MKMVLVVWIISLQNLVYAPEQEAVFYQKVFLQGNKKILIVDLLKSGQKHLKQIITPSVIHYSSVNHVALILFLILKLKIVTHKLSMKLQLHGLQKNSYFTYCNVVLTPRKLFP